MENLTEEPRWPHAAPAPNPASVTLGRSFTELSRIIHVSNQHTSNFQRSKTEHEEKLDGKFANMQKIHPGLCLQLAAAQAAEAAFVCICSSLLWLWVFSGFQGRQAGRSQPEGAWEEAPAQCLELPRCWHHHAVPRAPSHVQADSLKSDLDQTSYMLLFSRAASSESSMKNLFLLLFTKGNSAGYQKPVISVARTDPFCCLAS